ncbi:MAG: cytochrome c biogenesis protein CcdA [Pseudomonadota bacterium]
MFGESISYSAAFVAGVLSFFSPCILPLIPAYFTFITGFSLDRLTADDPRGIRGKVFVSTVSFVLGFSLVFILLGASASFLGGLIASYQDEVRIAGGLVLILLGAHLAGLTRFKFLDVEKRLRLNKKPVHFLGTFLVGMAFGAGWSPCVGPLLGGILIIAGSRERVSEGMLLLSIYSFGLALPFLALSLSIHSILKFLQRGRRFLKYANPAAGALLALVGVLLITDNLRIIG